MNNHKLPSFDGETQEEYAGQHIYEDNELNYYSTTPFGYPSSFPNEGNLQSQRHAMRSQNWESDSIQDSLIPNQSVQWQSTQEQILQAGSSSGGNRLAKYQRNQHLKEKACDSILDPAAERKRIIDKNYRDRRKNEKLNMVSQLDELQLENANLKRQHESFTNKNKEMNQALQFHKQKITQHINDFGKLKRKKEKQSGRVKALLDKVAHLKYANLELEHRKGTIVTSSQNANLEEMIQLKLENDKLKYKNKRLKVKVEALCEKIISKEQDHTEKDTT